MGMVGQVSGNWRKPIRGTRPQQTKCCMREPQTARRADPWVLSRFGCARAQDSSLLKGIRFGEYGRFRFKLEQEPQPDLGEIVAFHERRLWWLRVGHSFLVLVATAASSEWIKISCIRGCHAPKAVGHSVSPGLPRFFHLEGAACSSNHPKRKPLSNDSLDQAERQVRKLAALVAAQEQRVKELQQRQCLGVALRVRRKELRELRQSLKTAREHLEIQRRVQNTS